MRTLHNPFVVAENLRTASQRDWGQAALIAVTAVAVILTLHWEVVGFTAGVWAQNQGFNHGFLIFPLAGWLAWKRRHAVAAVAPSPDFRGLGALALLGFVWELGRLAGVMVVQQYALVGMVPALVWALLGGRVLRVLAFPLAFLFLAVPFGEALYPALMDFTADFTVSALKLTGIPVYREGNFFSLPSGNWSVVEACSGLRYLVASLTLGLLYAYLSYRSLWRRALFTVLSAAVPILANGLRAYMIVMIGHLSEMRLATGIDHYIYGWVFFGVVMLLLFWIGSFWREEDRGAEGHAARRPPYAGPVPLGRVGVAAIAALAVAGIWPAHAAWLEARSNTRAVRLDAPQPEGWVPTVEPLSGWTPHFLHPRAHLNRVYSKDGKRVGLFVGYYRNQRQGAELIHSRNVIVSTTDKVWGAVGQGMRRVSGGGLAIDAVETRLRSPRGRLLVWHWYRVDGRYTASPYMAKLLEAKSRFLGRGDDGAVIVVYAPYDEDPAGAAAAMGDFAGAVAPALERMLEHVRRG
jgi:exosortase A